jgi:hypothetical protein
MANPLDQYSNPYQPEILGMNRQRKLAEMLIAQGQQQPQGQMVGGRFIPVAPTQNIANLFNTALGAYGMYQSDQKALDLANRIRQGETEAFADFMKIKQGRPAVVENTEMAGPFTGNVPKPMLSKEIAPAVPPNLQAAYANLFANPKASKAMRDMALGKLTAEAEGITLPEGSTRIEKQPDGTYKVVASGADKTSPEYKNYLLASKDPINPFKGSFVDYQTMLKRAGATSINMPSGEERKAGFMSNILDRNLLQMQTALGIDPTAVKPNVPASIVEAITGPNLLSRNMKPAQRQIVEDSQLDVLDAALTLRTGAAYTREQLNAMRETYFPVLGDKPQTVQAKKQRLESLLEGAYIAAGRAVPARVSAPPPPAPPTAREQLNIPKVNAPAITAPKFLGFEPAPTGQR